MKGKFITFEGGEGVGKSTQVKRLLEYMEKQGEKVVLVRQPGGTEISEQIRNIILDKKNTKMCPECEALLYAAARAQLMKERIIPLLQQGVTVICDRHLDSSMAYQGYARGLGTDAVAKINEMAIFGVEPDVTVFIDLPPEHRFRSRERTKSLCDRLEDETEAFHSKVYEGFLEIAKNSPRFLKIEPCREKDDTFNKIVDALKQRGIIGK